ncbi:MAG TPA: ABC transporter substrate-binding protein [Candidatus Methylomirabilis sp.]|nr:ABC transporter substrate-binding protein [Candidatus Methylomirabilis sp.]
MLGWPAPAVNRQYSLPDPSSAAAAATALGRHWIRVRAYAVRHHPRGSLTRAVCLAYDAGHPFHGAHDRVEIAKEPELSRCHGALLHYPVALAATLLLFVSTADAKQEQQPYRIGILHEGWSANHPTVLGLKAGLKELGLEEGRDITFDIRFTQGNRNMMQQIAATLAGERLDLLFACGEAAMTAAFDASPTTPIIFTMVGDDKMPRRARTGPQIRPNITGVSSLSIKLGPKRLEMLKTVTPALRRVWVVYPAADPTAMTGVEDLKKAESQLDLEIVSRPVWSAEEVSRTFEGIRPGDGLLAPENDTFDIPATILETSLARRIPAIFPTVLWVRRGGLVSYGADYYAQGLQAARLVAKVLHGARPEDLPIEGADRIDLGVNLKTATLLGLTVPRKILLRAEMVER